MMGAQEGALSSRCVDDKNVGVLSADGVKVFNTSNEPDEILNFA